MKHPIAILSLSFWMTATAAHAETVLSEIRCDFEGDKSGEFDRCRARVTLSLSRSSLYKVVCDGETIYKGDFNLTSISNTSSEVDIHEGGVTSIGAAVGDGDYPFLKYDAFAPGFVTPDEFEDVPAILTLGRNIELSGTCDAEVFGPPPTDYAYAPDPETGRIEIHLPKRP